MNTVRHQRRLRNMRLTWKYHFRYMGLWVFINLCLLVIVNVLIYLYLRESWINAQLRAGQLIDDVPVVNAGFVIGMAIECLLFVGATVLLAMTTAHRIAGPYIRLQRVFASVRDGNLDQKLKFREYDRLEDVERSFNEMMDAVRQRATKA